MLNEGTKEDLERLHFERFRETYEAQFSSFPAGDVAYGDKPDVIVRGRDRVLGVDLIQLFRDTSPAGSRMRRQEELQRRVVNEAAREWDGPPLNVVVSFDESRPITRSRVNGIVQELARLARSVLAASLPPLTVRRVGEHRHLLSREVAYVSLDPARGNEWRPIRSVWDMVCHPSHVQATLNLKNPKCRSYRLKANEVWLLIVLDGGKPSSLMTIDESVAGHRFAFSFDRALLFCRSESRLIELRKA